MVWKLEAGVAIFDHTGRLAYANPAFHRTPALAGVVDGPGYLTIDTLERLRRHAVLPHGRARVRSATIRTSTHELEAQVVPLSVAPHWTALVLRARELDPNSNLERLSLAVLVHELRGPLLMAQESLDALTQLAGERPGELGAAVQRQARSLARLGGVVQGLSDLNRAGSLLAERAPWTSVDLAHVVAEVDEMYHDLAASRGLTLSVAADRHVPPIRGHTDLLVRAVANLVDNAVKYASRPGVVRLSLRQRGALAVVEVADCGPGIAAADQDSVFAEFVRLSAARESGVPGTGLGLAVARRVAEAHGGRLTLDSGPETGSAFRLSFLLRRGESPTTTSGRDTREPALQLAMELKGPFPGGSFVEGPTA
ncbi:MAG: sensor histidine kinase [Candidatus Dormibacteria bacterium]